MAARIFQYYVVFKHHSDAVSLPEVSSGTSNKGSLKEDKALNNTLYTKTTSLITQYKCMGPKWRPLLGGCTVYHFSPVPLEVSLSKRLDIVVVIFVLASPNMYYHGKQV